MELSEIIIKLLTGNASCGIGIISLIKYQKKISHDDYLIKSTFLILTLSTVSGFTMLSVNHVCYNLESKKLSRKGEKHIFEIHFFKAQLSNKKLQQ